MVEWVFWAVAAVAVGAWRSLDDIVSHVETVAIHRPTPDASYEAAFAIYESLYPALRAIRPDGGAL